MASPAVPAWSVTYPASLRAWHRPQRISLSSSTTRIRALIVLPFRTGPDPGPGRILRLGGKLAPPRVPDGPQGDPTRSVAGTLGMAGFLMVRPGSLRGSP